MFHRWNMRQGGPVFAGGGPGPEAYWAARRAEQEQAPQGWQDWHGHGGHGPGGHGPWQGGPPWMRHGGPGFAPPWAWRPWAMRRGFGGGFGGPRAFGRGDLKYSLLGLLSERPKHGYEMIKELEVAGRRLLHAERRGGLPVPAADGRPRLDHQPDGRRQEGLHHHRRRPRGAGASAKTRPRSSAGPGAGWGGRHGHHGGPFGHAAGPELEALRDEGVEVARLLVTAVMRAAGRPGQAGPRARNHQWHAPATRILLHGAPGPRTPRRPGRSPTRRPRSWAPSRSPTTISRPARAAALSGRAPRLKRTGRPVACFPAGRGRRAWSQHSVSSCRRPRFALA